MKRLATNIEQGLILKQIYPPETADMRWTKGMDGKCMLQVNSDYQGVKESRFLVLEEFPAWSLSRLIELAGSGLCLDKSVFPDTGDYVYRVFHIDKRGGKIFDTPTCLDPVDAVFEYLVPPDRFYELLQKI